MTDSFDLKKLMNIRTELCKETTRVVFIFRFLIA